jgi:uroporphyrinogen-III decarboxylase
VGGITSIEDAERLCRPFTGWGTAYLNGLSRLIDELGNNALVMPHHSPAYICTCYAFGFEQAMTTMLENPDLFRHVMDIYTRNEDLRMRELREAGAEAVFFADGWSSTDIVSPEMYEEFCYPSQAGILKAAREAGLKAVLWDEGDIIPQLPRLSTLPFDAFAAEQPRKGADISISKLRDAFKGKCLFGNIDSEGLFINGDFARVEAQVRKQIDDADGAPFIAFTGSPLPDNAAPELVDAYVSAAKNYSGKSRMPRRNKAMETV